MAAFPHVTLVFAASLDGKIASAARDPVDFTSRRDREHLHALRDQADAILVGAGTIRAEDPPLLPSEERARAREERQLRKYPVRAVVSATLDLPLGGRALGPREGSPVVAFTARSVTSERRVAAKAAGLDVRPLGDERVDLKAALESLTAGWGCTRVLAEGGGEVAWGLLERDLVEDVHLTVCPVVIGGAGAPTAVEGAGFARGAFRKAELVAHRVEGGEVFLHYRFPERRPR